MKKSWLKTQHSKNYSQKDTQHSWYPVSPLHITQMREKWKQWQILFSWASKSLWTLTAATKLKHTCSLESFPCGSDDKASACNAGDLGSMPGLGRSPGEGNGNLLQYSCLENPMDRGALQATVHRVAKSQTRLSDCFAFAFFLLGRKKGYEKPGQCIKKQRLTLPQRSVVSKLWFCQ